MLHRLWRAKSSCFLWVVIPLLTTINQACIKFLAERMHDVNFGPEWLVQALQSPWTAAILVCEIASFVLWLTILADTSISKATPITAIAYLLILGISWGLFHEPVLPLQIVGSVFILGGVWLIGTASSPSACRASS